MSQCQCQSRIEVLEEEIAELEEKLAKQQAVIDRIVDNGAELELKLRRHTERTLTALDKLTDIVGMQGEIVKMLMAEYDTGKDDEK